MGIVVGINSKNFILYECMTGRFYIMTIVKTRILRINGCAYILSPGER